VLFVNAKFEVARLYLRGPFTVIVFNPSTLTDRMRSFITLGWARPRRPH
jgi:hypothetical protein